MIGLIQRVTSAKVEVDQECIGAINTGILLLLGIEKEDTTAKADRLLQRVSGYRLFEDDTGRMNYSLRDIKGELLIISQFTLAANTNKGMRPSFSSAAAPDLAEELYHYFIQQSQASGLVCQSGQFGADMQVSLVNNGPVTFRLSV
jgi:D-tyrosyl-tRNA(Tyr) deacylase